MKKFLIWSGFLLFICACAPTTQPTPIVITATSEPTQTETILHGETAVPTNTRIPTAVPSATMPVPPTPEESATFQAVIDADRLNLRDAPTISSEVLLQMEEGEIVTVIGKYGGGEWVKVATDQGLEGWFYTEFLALQGELEELADLDVENGIRISGRVIDSLGNPVNAVQLTLIGEVSQDLISDNAGFFGTLLAPGMSGIWEIRIGMPKCESIVMDLNCQLAAYFYYNTSVLIALPEPSAAVFIFEQATGTVSGSTLGADSLPEGQLRVVAVREDGAMSSVYSDENGDFRLPIGPGKWRLVLEQLGEEGEAQYIEIGEFQSVEDILLVVP